MLKTYQSLLVKFGMGYPIAYIVTIAMIIATTIFIYVVMSSEDMSNSVDMRSVSMHRVEFSGKVKIIMYSIIISYFVNLGLSKVLEIGVKLYGN